MKNKLKNDDIKKPYTLDVQRTHDKSRRFNAMPPTKPIQVRLSAAHLRILHKLSLKTGLDRSNVIRLAINRMSDELLKKE